MKNYSVLINLPELRAELARRDWAWWELAAKLGVGQTTLSGWINGRNRAPGDLASRVEDILGLTRGALAPMLPTEAPRAVSL